MPINFNCNYKTMPAARKTNQVISSNSITMDAANHNYQGSISLNITKRTINVRLTGPTTKL
jgi:hypothetical protein